MLVRLGGWHYYTTPLAVRGYDAAHRALRPSGPVGQTLGVVGGMLMLVPFLYMLRKRFVRWTWAGSMKTWLEVHLFCGILGPVLITFHTSFKFNGIIVGRLLGDGHRRALGIHRALPLRPDPADDPGHRSVSRGPRRAEPTGLLDDLVRSAGDGPWLGRVRAFADARPDQLSIAGLLFGEIGLRRRLGALARELRAGGLSEAHRHALMGLTTERALLVRRIAYLERTKTAFGLWHVFHVPLVYFLLIIACVHVGITLYLGYIPFRW